MNLLTQAQLDILLNISSTDGCLNTPTSCDICPIEGYCVAVSEMMLKRGEWHVDFQVMLYARRQQVLKDNLTGDYMRTHDIAMELLK